MWRSSNLTTLELQTFSPDSKFDECFKRFVVEYEFVEKSLFYDCFHMHRQPESADRSFFSQIQPITQTTVIHNFCSVVCYTLLIWTPFLLTLGNNIVLQLLKWPKLVHCILTDKISSSIRIRIRRILKVIISIRRMQILTSFVTSLILCFAGFRIRFCYSRYYLCCCWCWSVLFAVKANGNSSSDTAKHSDVTSNKWLRWSTWSHHCDTRHSHAWLGGNSKFQVFHCFTDWCFKTAVTDAYFFCCWIYWCCQQGDKLSKKNLGKFGNS